MLLLNDTIYIDVLLRTLMATKDPVAMIHTALGNPKFVNNHAEFWNMLGYMMKRHEGVSVWQLVSREDICELVIQTKALIESIEIYEEIQKNAGHLYNAYMIAIAKLKGSEDMQHWEAHESLHVMKSVLHMYKTLKSLTLPIEMPPYGMLPSTYRTYLTKDYKYGSLGINSKTALKRAGNMSFTE